MKVDVGTKVYYAARNVQTGDLAPYEGKVISLAGGYTWVESTEAESSGVREIDSGKLYPTLNDCIEAACFNLQQLAGGMISEAHLLRDKYGVNLNTCIDSNIEGMKDD